MDGCLVSIIIPIYNTEKYIKKTLDSALSQTYMNLEIICIDDASPDNAASIVKEYAKNNDCIRLIHNECNLGLERTRNRGIDAARGAYVIFLDSDDTIAINMIESMTSIVKREPYDIVMSSYMRIVEGKEIIVKPKAVSGEYTVQSFLYDAFDKFSNDVISCVGTKMYKREFLNKNNIRFNMYYKYNEDMGFFLTSISLTDKLYFINEAYYKYYIRNTGSIMSSYRPNMFNTIIHIWETCKELFKSVSSYEKKKEIVNYNIYVLMLSSLINEYKFGDKKSLYTVLNEVRSYYGFQEMFESLYNSNRIDIKHRITLQAIHHRWYTLVYLLLFLRKDEKRQ